MAEKVVIGNAELYHGDCLEILPILSKMDGVMVVGKAPRVVVISDPPYGIGYDASHEKYKNGIDRGDAAMELAWTNFVTRSPDFPASLGGRLS